MDNNIPHARI